MENDTKQNEPTERERITLEHDLGTFEAFSFRDQCAIMRPLTAEEVVNWDHDAQGEAEFWASGDDTGVKMVLSGSSITFDQIIRLDEILTDLGDDDEETYVKIAYAIEQGNDLADICERTFDDMNLNIYRGTCWYDLTKEAGYDIFENFYPETYKIWNESNIDGLTFDPEHFIKQFSSSQFDFGSTKYLVVSTS